MIPHSAERISNGLLSFLMCDVILSAVGCLTNVSNGMTAIDNLVSNELQTISDFLSWVIDGNSLQQITMPSRLNHIIPEI